MILVDDLIVWAKDCGLPCDVAPFGDIAIFSVCRRMRYVVTRKIGESTGTLLGCGLNPSKADAFTNDQTVSKFIGFAQRWNCGLYVMLNAYAFIATNPKDMLAAAERGDDVIGQYNDSIFNISFNMLDSNDIPLAAWGTNASNERQSAMDRHAMLNRWQWLCVGENDNGSPKHLLYQPYTAKLRPWSPP